MNKKELTVVIVVLLLAVAAGGVAIANPGSKEPSKTAEMSQHEHDDGSHSHHEQDTTSTPATAEDLTSQSEVLLTIKDFAYSKPAIRIKKGTKVTWTNQDTMEHNVMREHDDSSHAHAAPTAEEVQPDIFAGPLLKKGESYSFTFNEAGIYPYHCAPHPYMQGSITVVE